MEAVTARLFKDHVPERRADLALVGRATDDEVPTKASDVDPYEVAYWRGGEREVMKLRLFDLVQRGYLEVRETPTWLGTERWLAIAHSGPARETLSDREREFVDWFGVPRMGSDICTSPMSEYLTSGCEAYRARLEEAGLISGSSPAQGYLVWARAYRNPLALAVAFAAGAALHSASVSLFLSLVASCLAYSITRIGLARLGHPRLTTHGRARLKDLRAHFNTLKKRVADGDADHSARLTAVALFGTSILAGSSYDAFAAALEWGKGGNWSISVGSGDGDGGCGGCGGCGD